MAAIKSNHPEKESDREIVSTRVFDSPRELVWKAWTDPNHLKEWWGPKGFTNTFHEFDLGPGGTWRFVMHGPNGTDFHNESVFVEIAKPERIVFQHLKPLHKFQVSATFAEQAGKTKVTFKMLFETAAECDKVKAFVVDANEQNFDRLEAQLAKMSGENAFVISRMFDAPRELLWKPWTDCNHLKHWWGPKGFAVRVCKLDFRPGGMLHYCLRGPDGSDMWGKFVYREIAKPERLVFVDSFSDEKGGATRHPLHLDWPLEMLSTITFAEHNGKTKLTIVWIPINATAKERKTFDDNHQSMQQGWTGTLDQLSDYLAKVNEGKTQ